MLANTADTGGERWGAGTFTVNVKSPWAKGTDLGIKLLVSAGVHKTHRPHLAPSTLTVLVCTAAQFDAIVERVRS